MIELVLRVKVFLLAEFLVSILLLEFPIIVRPERIHTVPDDRYLAILTLGYDHEMENCFVPSII